MPRALDVLRTDDLPLLTRPNFLFEMRHTLLWATVAGAVEGNVIGVVVNKTFGGSPLLTTVVWALPLLGNLLNLMWGVAIRGRRRLGTYALIAGSAAACVLSVGFVSSDWRPWGGWFFAGQLAATHLFISGLITLRSAMWQVNYPASHRAQVVGRLQTLRFVVVLVTTGGLGLLFDQHAELYRLLYPLIALLGGISLLPLRRMHMRGEKSEIRRFRERQSLRHIDSNSAAGFLHGLRESLAILRTDAEFTKYMAAQFLLGAGNFFTEPILVNIVGGELGFSYFAAIFILHILPTALILVTIQPWARHFDRVGVLRFRVWNSFVWTGSYVCISVAMLLIAYFRTGVGFYVALAVLLAGRVLNGAGRGGGAIGWSLGHLHFAREHQADLYMSIHVALTGVRGLLMPLAGWAVYGWLGKGSFLIALGLSLSAHEMFRRLYREDPRAATREEAHARELRAPPRTEVT